MAYDKVVDSSVLDAGLKAIADAIREKGGTSDNLAFPTAMADAVAAIESGSVDVSLFEGMGFEEGSFALAADTCLFDNLVSTSFGQCYGGFVFAEQPSAVSSSYFRIGFYLAFPDETDYKRECVHASNSSAYLGSNSNLGGYYPSNCIYITDAQSRLKYQAGKTYKWVAWGA